MSKNPAAPLAGGKPLSHARGANSSLIPPETCIEHHETAQSWSPVGPTISAMGAQGARQPHASYMLPAYEAGQAARRREGHAIRRPETTEQSPPGHGGAGDITQSVPARPRPSYVPPPSRRREQEPRPATEPPPAEPWAAPPSPPYVPSPQRKRDEPPRWNTDNRTPPPRTRRRDRHAIWGTEFSEQSPSGHGGDEGITQSVPARPKPSYVPPSQRRREQPPRPATEPPPAEAWAPPPSTPYVPPPQRKREEPPPRRGRITAAPGGEAPAPPRRTGGLPNPEPLVRHTTLGQEDFISSRRPPPPPRAHDAQRMSSPARAALGKRKQSAAALCFTACCILFWLLAIAVGLGFLVVYLRYRPQPPRMRVAAASLNRTTLGGGGEAAAPGSYSLAVEVDIYNPNAKLHVVLRYMRLDLYFHDSLVGTQAVTPAAALREGPGDSERRAVQLVIGVSQDKQDVAAAWQNATTAGTEGAPPVVLRLVGRFHAQLNFGRWLPFRFWTYPRCTLWLDPPPGGALRGSKC
ncbi:unnamed protein product [Urochloa humidicola]